MSNVSEIDRMKAFADMRHWAAQRYFVVVIAGVGWLMLSGIPTGIIETPFFIRMTPVEWWNYPFWAVSAVLVGLLAATYVSGPVPLGADKIEWKVLGGGLFSVLATGCPTCNQLVVLTLGAGGVLTYFAPIQPLLGFLSLGLLFYGLHLRLMEERVCPREEVNGANR